MKKVKVNFLVLITILFISSCSSSEDNLETGTVSASLIIAKWEEQPVNTECSQTETIEFFTNGILESLDLINAPCDYQLGSAEYTLEDDILEVDIEDNSFSDGIYTIRYNIITLNETTLIVEPFYDDEVGVYTRDLERFTYTKLIESNEQSVQNRLDNGETPCEIYQSDNLLLDELYGLSYQGGLIFYFDTTNCGGMIASPNDQSTTAQWGCEGTNIADAENSSIGFGLQNTNAIINDCSMANIAAQICYSYSLNSNDEWYLPSKDELNLMYTNLKANGLGDFSNDFYWSSTEFEDQSSYDDNGFEAVWVQSFEDGVQTTYDVGIKRFENSVRAIRNF